MKHNGDSRTIVSRVASVCFLSFLGLTAGHAVLEFLPLWVLSGRGVGAGVTGAAQRTRGILGRN